MADNAVRKVRVCCGMTCKAEGAKQIMTKLEKEFGIKAGEKNNRNDLGYCQCTGYCHMAPNVIVNENLVHNANEVNIIEEINKAEKGGPDYGSIHVTDAALDDILENDFLGDLK